MLSSTVSLQKLYAVISCDSEVIPSLSLRHLVESHVGKPLLASAAMQVDDWHCSSLSRLQLSSVTDKILVGQTQKKGNNLLKSQLSSMWKVKREIIT